MRMHAKMILVLAMLLCIAGCRGSGPASRVGTASKGTMPALTLGDKLYDVSARGKSVWAVGYFGTIVHSPDGGTTWMRQDPGSTASLLGVSFINDKEGWAVGEQGLILHTLNGGTTWEKQTSPIVSEDLFKVQCLPGKECFAVGAFGVILHTQDGTTWERLPFSEDVTLNDLVFLDGKNGWVSGEFQTILHTTDGGRTWKKQYGDREGKLFGISFRNAQQGIAVGTSGMVVVTTNGGATWREVGKATEDTLLKVRGYGSSRIVAAGLRGAVVASEDDGASWSFVALPSHYGWLCGMDFTGPTGYLVGEAGTIFMSCSGGTWLPVGAKPVLR
jgi:photosystem II stability/assembly factor-like uncharacterized protein